MQAFQRGWSFIKQAWQMAMKDNDLLKPSVYALLAGFAVTLAFAPLMIGGWLLFSDRGLIGQIALIALSALLIFAQYAVGYIFSAMTIYLIYGYLAEGDGRMDKAWAIVKRDWLDILSLAAASTLVNIVKNQIKDKGKNQGRNFLAGLIDTVWTEAAFLTLPAMVIEDINLKDGLKRTAGIVRNNLLLIGISTVGVKAVNGLIGFLLGGFGIALGLGVGLGIISLTGPQQIVGLAGGIGLGVVIAGIFIMAATVLTSYTATAYHTCLYLWAREVEKAQGLGQPVEVPAPEPLAAALR